MLKKLTIRNVAIIEFIEVTFAAGLNILTGETGAGKSIILGALGLLLGEKGGTDLLRKDADKAVVEGTFILPKPFDLSVLNIQCDQTDNELILRREIGSNGRSRCFINDTPITIGQMSALGDTLVDLHGQHDHQILLRSEHHIRYLDDFGIEENLLKYVNLVYQNYRKLQDELKILRGRERELRAKKELLDFQVREIQNAAPKSGEEPQLEQEERILTNSEKLVATASAIRQMLYEGEEAVTDKIAQATNSLTGLIKVDPIFEAWANQCDVARISLEEIVNGLDTYMTKVEYNPDRLQDIRDRLGLFTRLKKKYGATMDEVLQFLAHSIKELDQIENLDENLKKLSESLSEETQKLTETCIQLSKARNHLASQLETLVMDVLNELGLKNGVFKIHLTHRETPEGLKIDDRIVAVSSRGIDQAEFLIALNPGEDLKPLAKVASGGEISRIMLALKTVLARSDRIPVMVFDEIDSGISGRIARVVGRNLSNVATDHQVICITHLPQIASMGEAHFVVRKEVRANRSFTLITPLVGEERVHEIAKLIGGDNLTPSALESARELLRT